MKDLDQEAVQPQSLSFAIIVSVCMNMTTILSVINFFFFLKKRDYCIVKKRQLYDHTTRKNEKDRFK